MSDRASEEKETVATEGGTRWAQCAVFAVVCALVVGCYARSANSGVLELLGSGAQNSYYNLQVQGFRDGHLSVKREAPPNLGDPAKLKWEENYGLDDLSYYKGKLYLYFGVTPALMLFWPYAALTGHYLSHKDAVVIFFSAGFLAGAGLLWAVWRRYFKENGVGVAAAGMLALGLANFAPAILGRCDVYEVAVGCGYALTMLALAGVWLALHDERHPWRWLAAASLAYGLAVGARPSLLLGGIILLAPVVQAWREKRRVWPMLLAAGGPIAAIGVGLMCYNALRFDNPLEFGQRYQLPLTVHQQFRLRYLWFNFRVGFLDPARWSGHFPFVNDIAAPALPAGYGNVHHPFGVLTSIPLVWVALAAPLAWRGREGESGSRLRWFLGAVALLFGMCALPLVFHDSLCVRYEIEFASPLVLLAAVGALALERALAGQPAWRRAARCGWGLLLAFSAVVSLFASFALQADDKIIFGDALLQKGSVEEAITLYQKALELAPNDPEVYRKIGNTFAKYGRADEAISLYQKALRMRPDSALTCYNLGTALIQKGRIDEAIVLFQKALQMTPGNAFARYDLGTALLQTGRVDEAISQYQKALEIKPDYALACNNLGNALLQKGRVDEGILQYQKAVQIQPDFALACNNLGTVFQETGRLDEAITQYQKAVQIEPDFASAHLNLGNALVQKGRTDEAIPEYQKALQLNPADPAIQNNLAWVLATSPQASLRNGGKALELARQASLLAGGENPVILHTLAAACAEAGRFSEAVETVQHALRLAEAQTNTALAGALQSELKLYQAGSPFHSPGLPH
jgi:tetratricopeptide (TPR) repeat protein